jgi:hypothetical protein
LAWFCHAPVFPFFHDGILVSAASTLKTSSDQLFQKAPTGCRDLIVVSAKPKPVGPVDSQDLPKLKMVWPFMPRLVAGFKLASRLFFAKNLQIHRTLLIDIEMDGGSVKK